MDKYIDIPELTKRQFRNFYCKIEKSDNVQDCWQWLGSRIKPTGHGRVNLNGTVYLAHRVSYSLYYGELPQDMVVRHKCNSGACCNPAHLVIGTQADNVSDMLSNTNEIIRNEHPLPNSRPWAKFNGRKDVTVEERFWDKVEKSGDGCWIWKAALFPNGYGHFKTKEKDNLSHRFAWELQNGKIPEGMILLHSCDTPACVRVSHLKLGTSAENSEDMVKKGRQTIYYGKDHPSFGKRSTHCKKGHEMTDENTVMTDGGKARRCKTCYMETNRRNSLKYLNHNREKINNKKRLSRASNNKTWKHI